MDAQNYTIIYFGSDESNPSCAYWGIVPNETMMVMNPMMPSSPMVPVPNSMPTWSLPPMMPMGSILPMMPPMIPVDGGVWVPWMPGGFDAMNMLKATCAGGAERCVGEAFLKDSEEPEPEVEGSLTGMTATPPGTRTVDKTEKTSELMKSLAKKLWSDLDGEEAQETPAEVIDLMLADGAPQAGEDEAPEKVEIQVDRDGHIKGLEILNLLKRGKVAPSETGESLASIESTEICERSTVASTVTSPRNRKRRSPGQRRFCCNFILDLPPHFVRVIIGKGGERTKAIFQATNCKIRVRGRGSGHKEQGTEEEAPTPLMLAVTAEPSNKAGFLLAVRQSIKLLEAVEEQYYEGYKGPWEPVFWTSLEDEEVVATLTNCLGRIFTDRYWPK